MKAIVVPTTGHGGVNRPAALPVPVVRPVVVAVRRDQLGGIVLRQVGGAR